MDLTAKLQTSTIKTLTAELIAALDIVQENPSICTLKKDGTRVHPYAELTLTYDHEGEYYSSTIQRENWERWEDQEHVRKYVDYGHRSSYVSRGQWDKGERRRGYDNRKKWEGAVRSTVAKAKKLQKQGYPVTLWLKK